MADKIAFVINGSGATGSFQVALMRKLATQGITPDLYCGSSSGAVNACGAAYLGLDGLAKLWAKVNSINSFFRFNWLTWPFKNGFYNPAPLHALVSAIVHDNVPKAEVVVSRVNFNSGAVEYVSNAEVPPEAFAQAVVDSATIPAIIQTTNGYVDGAMVTDCPLIIPMDRGYADIYAILGCPPEVNYIDPAGVPRFFPGVQMAMRLVGLMLNQILVDDLKLCLLKNTTGDHAVVDLKVYGPGRYLWDPLAFKFSPNGLDPGVADMGQWVYDVTGAGWRFKKMP